MKRRGTDTIAHQRERRSDMLPFSALKSRSFIVHLSQSHRTSESGEREREREIMGMKEKAEIGGKMREKKVWREI